MSYSFLKIQTIEPVYLLPFLKAHPKYKQLSYAELADLYLKQCYGWNTNYSAGLRSLGNDAGEICVNFEFLQKLWAREHAIKYSNQDWFKDILSAQLKVLQPDVILLDDLYVLDVSVRQFLRENSPRPIKILGWRAAPTEDYGIFKDIDLMLTCTPLFARKMREHGAEAELMLHAFEPAILDLVGPAAQRDVDFSFIGTIALRNGYHMDRFNLVKHLMDVTNLELWGIFGEPQQHSFRDRMVLKFGYGVDKAFRMIGLPDQSLARTLVLDKPGPVNTAMMRDYAGRVHPPAVAQEYFRVLSRSKLTLNKHIDCADGYAGNIRLFEATGMGACLVTDSMINLPEMFEPDSEVISYRTAAECAEKVHYLLDHQDELREIAIAGQRRTLRDHTYQRRAEQLHEIIGRLLANGASRSHSFATNGTNYSTVSSPKTCH
jgi:spore maturation protein CgeB